VTAGILLKKSIVLGMIGLFGLAAAAPHDHAQSGGESSSQTGSVSQIQEQELVFRHLTIDDGLSDNSVYHIFQDRQGFIWATTVNGINKYDGMSFTTFMPQAKGDGQRTPQFYQAMLEDRDGILWFCNYGAGLLRHDPNNLNSLGYNILSQIKQDAAGMLWIGTYGGGLEKYDPATGIFTHYRHDPTNPESLSSDTVETLWIEPDGSMWIGTDDGLNHFDPLSGRAVRYLHDKNDESSLSSDNIFDLRYDPRGWLWVVAKLYHFSGQTTG
jgi:ligand-binding sensor domain-containing protein